MQSSWHVIEMLHVRQIGVARCVTCCLFTLCRMASYFIFYTPIVVNVGSVSHIQVLFDTSLRVGSVKVYNYCLFVSKL